MEFPVTVQSIEFADIDTPISPKRLFGGEAGAWVAVRPVGDKKTYLGVLLGDYHPPSVSFNKESGALIVGKGIGNPAIWVPDLKRVVMGWGSWWGEIKTPEELRNITDADIENVWYVKAFKELSESKSSAP